MKKNLLLSLVALILGVSFLSSCSKTDSSVGPVITAGPVGSANTSNNLTITKDSSLHYTVSIKADGKIDAITIDKSVTLGSAATITHPTVASGFSGQTSYTIDFTDPIIYAQCPISYTFNVTDKNSNKATWVLTITKATASTGTKLTVSTFTGKTFGALHNSAGSFASLSTGTIYSQTQADASSSSIDAIYYYGATNHATIAAPNDVTVGAGASNTNLAVNFTTLNATTFYKFGQEGAGVWAAVITGAVYDFSTISASISLTKVTTLAPGDVIAFKTAAGKYGLINVTSVNAVNSDYTYGTLVADIKYVN